MPRAIFTVYLILWPVFTFNLTVSDLLRAPFTTWGWVGSAWFGLKCDFRITGESDTNGMDRDGGAAWWAYQSVLRLLRGLSRRQARLHRPFPMAICLCPLSFPILAPPFFLFISSSPSSSIAHFGLSALFDLLFFLVLCIFHTTTTTLLFSFVPSIPPGKQVALAIKTSNWSRPDDVSYLRLSL